MAHSGANIDSCHNDEETSPTSANQYHRGTSTFKLITTGIGMVLNGYTGNITGILLLLLLKTYGEATMNQDIQAAFTYVFLVGYIVGETAFGLLIDHIGRKKGLVIIASLILLGSIGSAASNGTTPNEVVRMLISFRAILGVALGGELPCSAVSTTESTSHIRLQRRGMIIIGTTYLTCSLGTVIAPVIAVILLAIFKDNLEPTWRLLVGFPVIPTVYILYYRMFYIHNDQQKRSDDGEKGDTHIKSTTWIFLCRYRFQVMIPTLLWMSYNFIYYPASVFSTLILDKVADNASVISTCSWNILISVFYLIGNSVSFLTVDTIGRRWTAILGLLGQALVAFIVGGCYEQLTSNLYPLFVVLYGSLLGFGEVSGMMPSICLTEYTPRDYRGTAYGIASGSAKAAGLVGVVTHSFMMQRFGIDGEFIIFGIIASLSCVTVFLFLQETSGPGVMEKADEDFERYLRTRSKA